MSNKERNITVQGNYIEGGVKNSNTSAGDMTIKDSFNSKESKTDDKVAQLLEQLTDEIKTLKNTMPPSQDLDDLAEDAQNLITESQRESPRLEKFLGYLDYIKKLSITLGESAKPVLAIIKTLITNFEPH
jgi:hypothetical protein